MHSTATLDSVAAQTSRHQTRETTAVSRPLSSVEGAEFNALVRSLIPCRNEDPELWFAEQAQAIAAAKALCQQCPLAATCLEGALERVEPWGVWGGESVVDGKIVAQKRGRGRPRKAQAA